MTRFLHVILASCLVALTSCGERIPQGALATALVSPIRTPTRAPLLVATAVVKVDDPYKIERLDTAESALVKLRKVSQSFREDELKQKVSPIPQRSTLKAQTLPGFMLSYNDGKLIDLNQEVWVVVLKVDPWTERRGPAGYELTSTYNAWIYVIGVETGTVFNVQNNFVKE